MRARVLTTPFCSVCAHWNASAGATASSGLDSARVPAESATGVAAVDALGTGAAPATPAVKPKQLAAIKAQAARTIAIACGHMNMAHPMVIFKKQGKTGSRLQRQIWREIERMARRFCVNKRPRARCVGVASISAGRGAGRGEDVFSILKYAQTARRAIQSLRSSTDPSTAAGFQPSVRSRHP